jgi:23S rRNA (uracil1939-C5)-methyltransferase
MRLAAVQPGFRALDLFSGVGVFALSMSRSGAHVTGIEENPAAVRDAKGNADRNGLRGDFIAGDAARVLRRLASGSLGKRWDVVLLDPPRAGAAACVVELARVRPRRIVYVSCDPATLARDIKTLMEQGYRLEEAVPLDLFPQTAHVETVAHLVRADEHLWNTHCG